MIQGEVVMGAPSYLVKKQDTYYFRQAIPQSIKSTMGKREIVKSLGVSDKSLAVRIAREFKVNLDDVVDQIISNPLTNAQMAVDFLDQSLKRIKFKYAESRGIERVSAKIQTVKPIPSSVPVLPLIPPPASVLNSNLQNHSSPIQSPIVTKTKE